jgi:PKHD-type hydroxylase
MSNSNKIKYFDWSLSTFNWEHWGWYENVFTDDQIDEIKKLSKDKNRCEPKKGEIENGVDTKVRNSEISFIYSNSTENQFIHQRLTDIISNVNSTLWNLDLSHIEILQYTKYNSKYKGHYDWHIDNMFENHRNYMRKLSFSVLLSDPDKFEGGDLELSYGGEPKKMPRQKNKMILFPSYTLHRVTPVTKGVRESLVGWIQGPRWK